MLFVGTNSRFHTLLYINLLALTRKILDLYFELLGLVGRKKPRNKIVNLILFIVR